MIDKWGTDQSHTQYADAYMFANLSSVSFEAGKPLKQFYHTFLHSQPEMRKQMVLCWESSSYNLNAYTLSARDASQILSQDLSGHILCCVIFILTQNSAVHRRGKIHSQGCKVQISGQGNLVCSCWLLDLANEETRVPVWILMSQDLRAKAARHFERHLQNRFWFPTPRTFILGHCCPHWKRKGSCGTKSFQSWPL